MALGAPIGDQIRCFASTSSIMSKVPISVDANGFSTVEGTILSGERCPGSRGRGRRDAGSDHVPSFRLSSCLIAVNSQDCC